MRFIIGDSLAVLRSMPDASVDLVVTSPPFLALRSYLPDDHPDKGKEMGAESSPGAYIDALVIVAEECRRVLAPHGSLCFELGDTFSGSGGAGGDYAKGGIREAQPMFRQGYLRNDRDNRVPQEAPKSAGKPKNNRANQPDAGPRTGPGRTTRDDRPGWPLAKSLCLIPEMFRFALVYGFNPFTGRETPRWRVRNVVRWHRPNPPVGALGDKWRPSTSDMVVACVSVKRYFDQDATRKVNPRSDETGGGMKRERARVEVGLSSGSNIGQGIVQNTAGAPLLDTWVIPTKPYKGAHYATFPPELVRRPIAAMCPARVCRTCGKPSVRVREPTPEYANRPNAGRDFLGTSHDRGQGLSAPAPYRAGSDPSRSGASFLTLGWTDCGHDDWRAGIVLDPFAGSGTTLAVALGLGRDAIGIDLDARNADLALARVGLFLDVEHHAPSEG